MHVGVLGTALICGSQLLAQGPGQLPRLPIRESGTVKKNDAKAKLFSQRSYGDRKLVGAGVDKACASRALCRRCD